MPGHGDEKGQTHSRGRPIQRSGTHCWRTASAGMSHRSSWTSHLEIEGGGEIKSATGRLGWEGKEAGRDGPVQADEQSVDAAASPSELGSASPQKH